MTPAGFDAWVIRVAQSPDRLDAATYAELAKPSIAHPVVHYSAVEPGLFRRIIRKYDKSVRSHEAMAAQSVPESMFRKSGHRFSAENAAN